MKQTTSQNSKDKHKGLHQTGKHYVIGNTDLKVGQQHQVSEGSEPYETLSAARKAQKPGMAIVRAADSKVISVR